MAKKLMLVLSVILTLTLLLSACGGGSTPPASSPSASAPAAAPSASAPAPAASDEPQEESGEPVELPGFHLGLMVYTNSGAWFDRIHDGVKVLAEATGCTITLADGSTPDEAIAAVENLCAAGVDGIIDLATGGVSHRLLQICEEYGVYFVGANNDLQNEDGFNDYKGSEFFVGSAYADDRQVSYDIMSEMIANGASKIALFGLPPGVSAAFDARFGGALEAMGEAGLSPITEARSFAMPESAQNLLTQFPDVEAIFAAVNSSNYLYQPLLAGGYGGKIQLCSFDEDNDVSSAFNEGIISHTVEGVNAQAQIAFVLMYNALTGNKLAMPDGSMPNILMPYVINRSADEFNAYNEMSKGGVYSYDELSQYIKLVNPGADLNGLIALAESLGK